MRKPTRRTPGFTLLELLVVIAIFGIMATMAYGGLASVLQTRARVEQSLERTAEYQKAYMRLRNDFQEARNRPARDSFGDLQPAFLGDPTGRVTLSRGGWRNPLLQPRPGIERAFYYLDADKKTLIRGSFRVLDQAQDSKPVELTLLHDVQDISWRYMDNTRSWQNTWPPPNAATSAAAPFGPPIAVELTLHTQDIGELRFLFRLGLDSTNTQSSLNVSGGGSSTQGITQSSNTSDSSGNSSSGQTTNTPSDPSAGQLIPQSAPQ